MLRINLLPPYIYEGAKRRNVIALWSVVLIAVVGGLIYYKVNLSAEADRIAKETDALEPTAKKADDTQTKANGIRSANAKQKAKTDFVASAKKYNTDTYPPVLDNVNMYTIDRVLYSSTVPANQNVTLSAYAPSLADVGHYILAMEKNPQISSLAIGISSIPGFPVGSGAQQAGGGAGSFTGMGRGGMGSGGGPSQMMRGFGGGRIPGGGLGSGGGFGGGFSGGGTQQAAGVRPPGGGGHDFTVTLTLAKPIPGAPAYPAGGGGQGAGPGGMMSGGGGMMSGGGGMMSGGGGMMSGGGAGPPPGISGGKKGMEG